MDTNLAIFLVIVIAISAGVVVTILTAWIRAKHGIPSDEEIALIAVRGSQERGRDMGKLVEQNEWLCAEVARLQQRLAVLERIATDPAERTAREIDSLR